MVALILELRELVAVVEEDVRTLQSFYIVDYDDDSGNIGNIDSADSHLIEMENKYRELKDKHDDERYPATIDELALLLEYKPDESYRGEFNRFKDRIGHYGNSSSIHEFNNIIRLYQYQIDKIEENIEAMASSYDDKIKSIMEKLNKLEK